MGHRRHHFFAPTAAGLLVPNLKPLGWTGPSASISQTRLTYSSSTRTSPGVLTSSWSYARLVVSLHDVYLSDKFPYLRRCGALPLLRGSTARGELSALTHVEARRLLSLIEKTEGVRGPAVAATERRSQHIDKSTFQRCVRLFLQAHTGGEACQGSCSSRSSC